MPESNNSNEKRQLKKDELIWESYRQAQSLTWDGKYIGNRFTSISWEVDDPNLSASLGTTICYKQISEVLLYHKNPNLLKTEFTEGERIVWPDRYTLIGRNEREQFFEYFLKLSQISEKKVNVYKYFSNGDSKFLFQTEPEMTPESRLAKMQELFEEALTVLSRIDNISQVWLFGSFADGYPLPQDIDLAVITSHSRKPPEDTSFFDQHTDDNNFEIEHAVFRISRVEKSLAMYLEEQDVIQLANLTKRYGIGLNFLLLPENIFKNPETNLQYSEFIKNVRKGRIVFERHQKPPANEAEERSGF